MRVSGVSPADRGRAGFESSRANTRWKEKQLWECNFASTHQICLGFSGREGCVYALVSIRGSGFRVEGALQLLSNRHM